MRRTWSAMGAVEVFAPVARGLSKRARSTRTAAAPRCSGTPTEHPYIAFERVLTRKLCNDRKRDEPINSVRKPRPTERPRWPHQ